MQDGKEVDYWYCGTYSATDDGGNPKKLGSLPGRAPFVNVNFPTMQGYCRNRNTDGVEGFDMWDIWQVGELQLLFLIEYACTDSQGIIGRGRVDTSAVANVDADDVSKATYRGHVGLWGNVLEMIAGIDVPNGGKIKLWKTDGSKEFVQTDMVMPPYNGSGYQYPATFMTASGDGFDYRLLFIPETQTSSLVSATAPDGLWGRYGYAGNVVYLGGSRCEGSAAGLFCLSGKAPASSAHATFGCRLAKR